MSLTESGTYTYQELQIINTNTFCIYILTYIHSYFNLIYIQCILFQMLLVLCTNIFLWFGHRLIGVNVYLHTWES